MTRNMLSRFDRKIISFKRIFFSESSLITMVAFKRQQKIKYLLIDLK